MQSEQQSNQPIGTLADETKRPRFRIDKLEERIAPAKGGIPGKPPYHYPPGQCHGGWGYGACCKGGGPKSGCDI